jgi:hypothetical protein
MAIAAFLPLDEPTGMLRMIQNNSLVQQGGWGLIALAVGIAASGFWASQRDGKWPLTVVLCLFAAAQIIYWGMNKGTRTLYPVGPDGAPDSSQPGTVAALGIALYVAGAGVAAALVGALMLRQQERAARASAAQDDPLVAAGEAAKTTKKCPDCAETILADANVCKHCGYRFAASTPDLQQEPAPVKNPAPEKQEPSSGKAATVRCNRCQHVQRVPQSQATFACEKCGTNLRRRTTKLPEGS